MMRRIGWRRWMLLGLLGFVVGVAARAAVAGMAGPATIAKSDRHLWPDPIDTPESFDKASRASLLLYVLTLREMGQMSDVDMLAAFKIKSVNRASVQKWLAKGLWHSWANYQIASKSCAAGDWTCVGEAANLEDWLAKAEGWSSSVPEAFRAWSRNLQDFAHAYAAEQMRLAALFPKVTSEIDRFSDREWNGDGLPDRRLFLTFDDGPSAAGGTSDELMKTLEEKGKSGTFFVLGSNLQARLAKTDAARIAALYGDQCVASHGWEHQSHAKWERWQQSVKDTRALLASTIDPKNELPLFRPPYGQRRPDSGAFFEAQSLKVALWNLDSQDWNAHVSAEDIVNRMVALILIKRHGVLLFHDIHGKARIALPALFEELGGAVEWADCHQLTGIPAAP